MIDAQKVGENLRVLLARRRLNQSELARRSGVSQRVVNAICNERFGDRLALATMLKIAEALQVPLGDLVDGAWQPEPVAAAPPRGDDRNTGKADGR